MQIIFHHRARWVASSVLAIPIFLVPLKHLGEVKDMAADFEVLPRHQTFATHINVLLLLVFWTHSIFSYFYLFLIYNKMVDLFNKMMIFLFCL